MEQDNEIEMNEIVSEEIILKDRSDDELKSCILCLFPVSEKGETKLYKLPCECNTLCHKSCFKKLHNKRKCFICKVKYKKGSDRNKTEDIFLYEEVDVATDSEDSNESYEYFDYDDYVMRIITGQNVENDSDMEGNDIDNELDISNNEVEDGNLCMDIFHNITLFIFCGIFLMIFLFFSGILVNCFLFFTDGKELVVNIYSFNIFLYGLIGMPIIFLISGCVYSFYNKYIKKCVIACHLFLNEGIR